MQGYDFGYTENPYIAFYALCNSLSLYAGRPSQGLLPAAPQRPP